VKLISLNEVARRIGLSDKTVRKYRERLPGGVMVGARVLYREDAVLKFIEAGGVLAERLNTALG
jgi:predicted DNA-binding transcriptional regulator AlpA